MVHNNCGKTAFGLSEYLDDFADELGARTYWDSYNRSDSLTNDILEERLRQLIDDADEINVNLTGMGNNGEFKTFEDLLEAGQAGVFNGNATNWEVLQIFENYNHKAKWWLDGEDVTDILDKVFFD